MFKQKEVKSLYGVALVLIFLGVGLFTLGSVEWIFNYYGNTEFNWPLLKIIGGLIVLALGYIQLEVELLRKK